MKEMISFNTPRTVIDVFDMEQTPFHGERLYAVHSTALCDKSTTVRYCNLVQLHSIVGTYIHSVVYNDKERVWKFESELFYKIKEIDK